MNRPEEWIEVTLRATRDITPTVREFELVFPQPVTAPPGAHIEVVVPTEGGMVTRSYSLVRVEDGGTAVIAVKLLTASRGGSRAMWSLRPGARLPVSNPRCSFELSLNAPHYLLLAGGIGITPIVPMARALVRHGANVRMLYAARTKAELAYHQLLSEMLGDRLTLFAADEGKVVDIAAEVAALPADAELYMCGPIRLMDAVREEWARQGRHVARLRFETFGSSGHRPNHPFTVKIPRLGVELRVGEDRSLLDVLTGAGIEVLSGCRRGECGLCALDVVSVTGEIDHRDVFFSTAQRALNSRLCACVSRVDGGTLVVEPAWRGDPDLGQPEVLRNLEVAGQS